MATNLRGLMFQTNSSVMFGMNGFHISASGAIQGHHGPLVPSVHGLNLNKNIPSVFSVLFNQIFSLYRSYLIKNI